MTKLFEQRIRHDWLPLKLGYYPGEVIDRFYQGVPPNDEEWSQELFGYEELEVGQGRRFTGSSNIVRVQ